MRPLAVIVVRTVEQAVAAPVCTRHLGDLGDRLGDLPALLTDRLRPPLDGPPVLRAEHSRRTGLHRRYPRRRQRRVGQGRQPQLVS
jgi:hypothetical protein